MNRQVDYRTDLYSLGVTLYELFIGQLPFRTGSALEMIHCHIAREPKPPHRIDAGVPGPLSDIILKLLAKNAEDRYQTARGLRADLKICLDQWQSYNRIEPFELGSDDFTGQLQIPQKLYGRQAEIEQLRTILDRTIAGQGQLLLVAGYSGVGKTSVVREIHKDVISKQGTFVEGKFDQFQRSLPYSAWAQAFTQLVNNWLAESEANFAGWRDAVLNAVGDQGQILIDIVPALEDIIGLQPDVPQLGGTENQNRLNYTFNRLISSLARPEHPLIVFLDDLQWIDPASLSLIETLFAAQSTSPLLIIGAYRDNEVDADHPLVACLDRMSGESDRVRVINLADLAPVDIDQLLVDTLQLTIADCRELSQVLVDKTAGNPFYVRQQLYALESKELLSFDGERRRWAWKEDLQQSLQAGGNVVDLMISQIQTLPVETQQALSMAACLGSRFDPITLATIIGQPQTDTLLDLNPALLNGLIFPSNGHYLFAHDRIQEAGYALIPESERPTMHLEIGRLLLAGTTNDLLKEEIFDIVRHLNTGRALIDTDSEKIELAALNLKAGQKAKATAAYADAKKYIEIGIELLGPNSWQEQYELTLSLYNENGELAALTGQFDQISTSADRIHANAIRILDRVRIYMAQIEAQTLQYNFAKALEIGLEALKDLGVDIPARPGAEDYQRLQDRLVASLARRSEESWVDLPETSDNTALAASSLLASELGTTYVGNPSLYPIMAYEGAILTFKHGINAWSPFFVACVAMLTLSFVDLETPADDALDQINFAKRM
jgi:predicted ATPase